MKDSQTQIKKFPNSWESQIEDLRKYDVNKFLDDDWNLLNNIIKTVKMKTFSDDEIFQYSIKTFFTDNNYILKVKSKFDLEFTLKFLDIFMITKITESDFIHQLDRGFFDYEYKWKGKKNKIWINPYVVTIGTTNLKNVTHSAGANIFWSDNFSSRIQFNHDFKHQTNEMTSWDFKSNHRFNRGKLWIDYFNNFSFHNPLKIFKRAFRIGWNDKFFNLMADFDKNSENKENKYLDNLSIASSFKKNDWGSAIRMRFNSKKEKFVFEAAITKNIGSVFTFKSKFDSQKNIYFFTKMIIGSSLNLELAISKNLNKRYFEGLYQPNIVFGFKFNIEQ